MPAGYSGTPLIRKLGIKGSITLMPVNEPDHYFDLLGELPEAVRVVSHTASGPVDFIHLFAVDEKTLHYYLQPLKSKLAKDGSFWISWIKGSSKMETDINANDVRRLGLESGLVDVKVCAVDEDWSGLKFMYRSEDR